MTYTRRHYEKLATLVRDLGISVIERPASNKRSSNCFSRVQQSITVGLNNYWWRVIAGFAHEIGHCLSVRLGSYCTYGDMFLYRMEAVLDKPHAERLLREEKRAWNLGYRFMRRNGIEVDDSLLHARRVLLGSHKLLHEALNK